MRRDSGRTCCEWRSIAEEGAPWLACSNHSQCCARVPPSASADRTLTQNSRRGELKKPQGSQIFRILVLPESSSHRQCRTGPHNSLPRAAPKRKRLRFDAPNFKPNRDAWFLSQGVLRREKMRRVPQRPVALVRPRRERGPRGLVPRHGPTTPRGSGSQLANGNSPCR